MNTAETYRQKQMMNTEFKQAYFNEKLLLDIEYQLDELRKSIRDQQPISVLLNRVDSLEKVIMGK